MGTTDLIESFILSLLSEADGMCEMSRAEIAERFSCVPSQVNYVLSTRFSPEHGYIVESRRGGGGYIRVTRVRYGNGNVVMHVINAVGSRLTFKDASALIRNLLDSQIIGDHVARLMLAAVGEKPLAAVPRELRDSARASIFKNMLLRLEN